MAGACCFFTSRESWLAANRWLEHLGLFLVLIHGRGRR